MLTLEIEEMLKNIRNPLNNRRMNIFVFFISSLIFTLILLTIAIIPSATAYEVDIYGIYPSYFWGLIIFSSLLGITIVMFSNSKKQIKYGFLIIVFTNLIILSIQFFRGYFFFIGGDLFTHVGFAKDISQYGHISSRNFYPLQHIFTVGIHETSGLSIRMSSRFLSLIFYLLFVITLYIFLRKYPLPKFKYCIVLGSLLIFGSQYISPLPNILSFFFFTSVLYLLFKLNISKYKIRINILLFIVCLAVVFFHPITSLYLLMVLITFISIIYFYSEFFNRDFELDYLNITTVSTGGVWFVWHMGFSSIRRGVTRTITSLFFERTINPRAKDITQQLGIFDIKILDFARKFIFEYGIFSILLLILLIYFIYLTYDEKKIKRFLVQKDVLFFSGLTFIFTLWSIVNIFADFVSFSRVFKIVILFSFLLVGLLFSFFLGFGFVHNIKKKDINSYVLVFLIVFLLLVSVFSVYPSSPSLNTNLQVTKQENEGMRWLFQNQNEDRLIWEEGIRQHRWADFIFGPRDDEQPRNIRREPTVKAHFGYEEIDKMGENYSGYFIMTEVIMITYRNIFNDYEEYWRFNETDFERLEKDDTVNRIYDNGFFKSYYIEEVGDT